MILRKTINSVLIFAVVLFLGCQWQSTRIDNENPVTKNTSDSHLGTWEMVFFQSINGKDTTRLTSDDSPLAVTLFTPTHFSYQWRNSSNSAAGTYTYDGKIIHQEFNYVQDSNFAGAILSFKMEVRNDSLIFSGPIKATSPLGENFLNQIPQMLEIRKRSD